MVQSAKMLDRMYDGGEVHIEKDCEFVFEICRKQNGSECEGARSDVRRW
jgi:hypothetical protein